MDLLILWAQLVRSAKLPAAEVSFGYASFYVKKGLGVPDGPKMKRSEDKESYEKSGCESRS